MNPKYARLIDLREEQNTIEREIARMVERRIELTWQITWLEYQLNREEGYEHV
jgi:hypothetical protein